MNNLDNYPTPAYSLADLAHDIRNGRAKTFTYGGATFSVERTPQGWHKIAAPDGRWAITHRLFDSMDFHGVAAWLLANDRTGVTFDKHGNLTVQP